MNRFANLNKGPLTVLDALRRAGLIFHNSDIDQVLIDPRSNPDAIGWFEENSEFITPIVRALLITEQLGIQSHEH